VLSVLVVLGAIALIVGLLFALPLMLAALVQAYEDAIGPTR
jgi:hypothetical protein